MDGRKFTMRRCDMKDEVKDYAIKTFTEAIEKGRTEKDFCSYMKNAFDTKYGPTWHCVVGRDFASHVTFDEQGYIHFQYGNYTVLVFKCG